MRATELSGDLAYRSRLPVGQQIEGGNLREGELAGRQLLRRGEDELAPEAADGDDAAADLAEALSATRHLVERALCLLASDNTNGGREATAQPLSGLRDLRDPTAARCMHRRIH